MFDVVKLFVCCKSVFVLNLFVLIGLCVVNLCFKLVSECLRNFQIAMPDISDWCASASVDTSHAVMLKASLRVCAAMPSQMLIASS